MLKIEHVKTYCWEEAIRGMRNAMNSWARSDSKWDGFGEADGYSVGEDDLDLMLRLAEGGSTHAKYRRMLIVTMDIVAPLYWWKEFDTYKVGTTALSCSTMHKIHAKEFEWEDFSWEHLYSDYDEANLGSEELAHYILSALNRYRERYLQSKSKEDWWQMIQLLPTSYNQRRTVLLNYEVLTAIYQDRRKHKLDEWRTLCDWIENLLHSEIITR